MFYAIYIIFNTFLKYLCKNLYVLMINILHSQNISSLNSEENIGDVYKILELDQLQVVNSTFWYC